MKGIVFLQSTVGLGYAILLVLWKKGSTSAVSRIISYITFQHLAIIASLDESDINIVDAASVASLAACLWKNDESLRVVTHDIKNRLVEIRKRCTQFPTYLLSLYQEICKAQELSKFWSSPASVVLDTRIAGTLLFPPTGYGDQSPAELKSCEFNPKYELVAFVYRDYYSYTLVIMAYAGTVKNKRGKLVYHHVSVPRDCSDYNIRWSSSGTTLAAVEQLSHYSRLQFFFYDPKLYTFRPCDDFLKVNHCQTPRCWMMNGQFVANLHNTDLLHLVKINSSAIRVESLNHCKLDQTGLKLTTDGQANAYWITVCQVVSHLGHSILNSMDLTTGTVIRWSRSTTWIFDLIPDCRNLGTMLTAGARRKALITFVDDNDEDDDGEKYFEPTSKSDSCGQGSPWLTKHPDNNFHLELRSFAAIEKEKNGYLLSDTKPVYIPGTHARFKDFGIPSSKFFITGENDHVLVGRTKYMSPLGDREYIFFKEFNSTVGSKRTRMYCPHPKGNLFCHVDITKREPVAIGVDKFVPHALQQKFISTGRKRPMHNYVLPLSKKIIYE